MKPSILKSFFSSRETWLHIVVWTLFFATINVIWTKSWIQAEFLPESVAPHIALSIPVLFLANVYWLIPKFLNRKKWMYYITISFTLLMGFEVLRAFVFSEALGAEMSFEREFFGNNSIVFGVLNVMTFTIIFYSFLYRFGRDWVIHQSVIEKLKKELKSYESNSERFEDVVEVLKKRDTFSIKKRDGIILLKVKDVVYFQAQGDFVLAIDKEQKKHIINDSLRNVIRQIDAEVFFQINRSEAVNFHFIEKYDAYIKNRLGIKIQNSEDLLYTSNSRTPMFRSWIKSH